MTPGPLTALARRDLFRAFSNPAGHIFIGLFLLLTAAAAFWPDRFFHDNLATLDQLTAWMVPLLVVFVPALAMGAWADERRQGTDDLLYSLPATDWALVGGKYLAVLGTFTAALLLSLSHVAILVWLGSPDPGLLVASMVGYWLCGSVLIALALLGSQLARSMPVAFVAATGLCVLPVLPGVLADLAGLPSTALLRRLALDAHLADLGRGVVSGAALAYAAGGTAIGLQAGVALLSRRRGGASTVGLTPARHHVIRLASLVIVTAASVLLLDRLGVWLDATSERVHSLSAETRAVVASVPPERPVRIQAFVSPDVPEDYVPVRLQLVNVLQAVQGASAGRIQVAIHDTRQYSDDARSARDRFGVVGRRLSDPARPDRETRAVFLGVVVAAGATERVIPFFERGVSPEYEIARAIRAVAGTPRRRVGLVDPDANLLGGMDYQAGRARLPWTIADELRTQYDLVPLSGATPIVARGTTPDTAAGVDALVVVLPARLLQAELDRVMAAIAGGIPALLLVDPAPAMDMRLAPAAAMAGRLNPYLGAGQAVTYKNTGDIQRALAAIGVQWQPARIAWDGYRPRADLSDLPWEVMFVGPGGGNSAAVAADSAITRGLREFVLMYAGAVAPSSVSGVTFDPLLSTGTLAGSATYFDVVQPSAAGPVLNPEVAHHPGDAPLTLAARVTRAADGVKSDVVVVADLDFVSNQFFRMRESRADLQFDNVAFLMNAIDVLAGDESLLDLRQRRTRHRTLERLERQTRQFMTQRSSDEQAAVTEAEQALAAARSALDERARAVRERADLDELSKQTLVRNLEELEARRLEVMQRNIQQIREGRIEASRETMEAGIRRIQTTVRAAAVAVPAVPMAVSGVLVALLRRRDRRRAAAAAGRLSER